jgi:integrase
MDRPYRRKGLNGRLLPTWYWEFRSAKRRYRGTAPSFDLAVDAMALKRKAVIEERIYGPPPAAPETISFGEFADNYFRTCCAQKKSSKRDKGILAFLKNRWPGKALRDLTVQDVVDLKAERIAIRSATTVGHDLQILKRMLKTAVELGKLDRNPATSVKKPKVTNLRVRYLDADQMKGLMAAATPWLREVITFARFTGCRRGETLALTWADVDLNRGLITLRDAKTGPA